VNWAEYYQLCRDIHAGQKRRGGEDYAEHCIRVCEAIRASPLAHDTVCLAALFHDAKEDQSKRWAAMIANSDFSMDAEDMVDDLTRRKDETYNQYIERIKVNPLTRAIKVADIVDNLTSDPTPEQVYKYRGALWILTGCATSKSPT